MNTGQQRFPSKRDTEALGAAGTFEPECLTVALGNRCNLACAYCYAKDWTGRDAPAVEHGRFLSAVCAAAEFVAATCKRRGRRMTFGFQGAGEPFCDFERLAAVDAAIRLAAAQQHVAPFSYITSNGTMAERAYRWAAERFDRVCISLDGPPETHDLSRRFPGGGATFAKARQTVELLKSLGKVPACRSTVTRDNVDQMARSAAFLFGEVGLREVTFEPAYYRPEFRPEPQRFVDGMLHAREIACRHGASALYSGFRPAEIHGPYCQTLRSVLFITPNGTASACLFRETEGTDSPYTIAPACDHRHAFAMDERRIAALHALATQLPETCTTCPLRNHCTRGCPDLCPVDPDLRKAHITRSLGCRINRLLFAEEQRARAKDGSAERVPAVRSELPEPLLAALRQLSRNGPVAATTQAHLSTWARFVDALRDRIPSVQIGDAGATVRVGELSPGCVYCKQAKWDCIFVTHRCNLSCFFCYAPKAAKRKGWTSAMGKSLDELIDNYLAARIFGIGVTGGEALVESAITFSLLEALRRKLSDRYIWLYTNGVLLHQDDIARLADLGLNEIRFNTRATGNTDPVVLQTIQRAAKRIDTVAVEIPAIPGDADTLINTLGRWADAGVKHLNLHELMREQGTNSARLQGEFDKVVLIDGHVTEISRPSREVIADVMASAVERRVPIGVNFCSLTNKLLQLRLRRRALAALCQEPHERLNGDVIESALAFASADTCVWVHPDDLDRLRHDSPQQRFFLLRRTAPLSLHDPGRWLLVQEVT